MIYLHLRCSTERQEKEGQGLDAQEAYGRSLFNYKPIRVTREVGSGRKESLEARPVLRQTLDQLKEGDILWFYDEDRMARDNGVKKEILKILRKKKAHLHIRNEEFDIYDMQDCLRLGLKGELDEYMGRFIVERMKAGRDIAVIQKGRWYGGITAFGYKKIEGDPKDLNYHNLIPDPEEAKIYHQIVKWCLDGLGTNKIAIRLNELGVPTNFSKKGIKKTEFKWQQQVVLKILKSPIYKGEFRYKDKILKVPSLISEKEWNRIQEQLILHAIYSPRNTKRFYLLRSLLYCAKCGRRFFGKIKENRGERLYCCLSKRPNPEPRSCGMRSINLDKANNAVWATIREYILHSKKLRDAIEAQKDTSFVDRIGLETELSTIKKRISEKDAELERLVRMKGKYSNIPEDKLNEIAAKITSEKGDLQITQQELLKKLTKLDSIDARGKEIEKFLANLHHRVDSLSDQEKYDVIHAIISKVVVSYNEMARQHHLDIKLALDESLLEYPASLNKVTTEEVAKYG